MMRWQEWLRREKATLGRLHGKQLRHYIWDYYKLPIFALALVAALGLAAVLYGAGNRREVLSVVLVNASPAAQEDTLFDELLEQMGGDPQAEHIAVDANYRLRFDERADEQDGYTVQALASLFGMGGMDVFVSDQAVFDAYVAKDGFEDLSLWLPPQVLEALADRLYWCTDTKGRRVAAGVWLDEASPLRARGYYGAGALLGIASQAEHIEEAVKLVPLAAGA